MNEIFWGIWDGTSLCTDPDDGASLWDTKEAAEKELEDEREWYDNSCIIVKVTVTLE